MKKRIKQKAYKLNKLEDIELAKKYHKNVIAAAKGESKSFKVNSVEELFKKVKED